MADENSESVLSPELARIIDHLNLEEAKEVLLMLVSDERIGDQVAEVVNGWGQGAAGPNLVAEIGEEVFRELNCLTMSVLYDRMGEEFQEMSLDEIDFDDGRELEGELAEGMVMNVLFRFHQELERHRELGRKGRARDWCMGILMGLKRYRDQGGEFFDVSGGEKMIRECAWEALDEWGEDGVGADDREMMAEYIREELGEWWEFLEGGLR